MKKRADIDQEQLEEYLTSHAIPVGTLQTDDFDAFFEARENELLDRIEKAMGKKVQREYVMGEDGYDDDDLPENAPDGPDNDLE